MKKTILAIHNLQKAYQKGLLGDTTMPEDTHPTFQNNEERLIFFSLPMALNYQRNSFKLWEAATETYNDPTTKKVFDLKFIVNSSEQDIRDKLLKHKLALQPNKHINTWIRISQTVNNNWGSFESLLESADSDFLQLRELVQKKHKKGFPYLSGPKIFNYWSYILTQYCDIELKNRNHISIAPDTHVIQATARLGIETKANLEKMSREEISELWRNILNGTGIDPIDMHSPLWFWSRSEFAYEPGTD